MLLLTMHGLFQWLSESAAAGKPQLDRNLCAICGALRACGARLERATCHHAGMKWSRVTSPMKRKLAA